jgi:hypothetical protein
LDERALRPGIETSLRGHKPGPEPSRDTLWACPFLRIPITISIYGLFLQYSWWHVGHALVSGLQEPCKVLEGVRLSCAALARHPPHRYMLGTNRYKPDHFHQTLTLRRMNAPRHLHGGDPDDTLRMFRYVGLGLAGRRAGGIGISTRHTGKCAVQTGSVPRNTYISAYERPEAPAWGGSWRYVAHVPLCWARSCRETRRRNRNQHPQHRYMRGTNRLCSTKHFHCRVCTRAEASSCLKLGVPDEGAQVTLWWVRAKLGKCAGETSSVEVRCVGIGQLPTHNSVHISCYMPPVQVGSIGTQDERGKRRAIMRQDNRRCSGQSCD